MSDPAHIATDKVIEDMEKRLAKEYAKAHKEVTAKMDDYLKRFTVKDKKWQEWVKNGTKTAEEYKTWKIGQVMTGKRWGALKDTLATDYQNAAKTADKIVNGYMSEVYAINHNYATFQIEKMAGVDTSYTLYSKESVERLMKGGKFYKSPGKAVTQQIKEGTLKAWEREQIQSVMLQGILQGESIPNLTKRLESVTGGAHSAAIRNARTMTTGIQNAGRIDAYNRANDLGIETMKTWVATLDRRTRHAHRQLDGVTVPVNEPFENEEGEIMYPGDPDAEPGNVYNCRCTLIASVKGHEADTINSRNYNKFEDMDYEEWLEGHSESQKITAQEEMGQAIRQSYIEEYKNG